ncbi:MAG: hypothetical protein ACTSRI_04665 [Promethearchaeota archaeon]
MGNQIVKHVSIVDKNNILEIQMYAPSRKFSAPSDIYEPLNKQIKKPASSRPLNI